AKTEHPAGLRGRVPPPRRKSGPEHLRTGKTNLELRKSRNDSEAVRPPRNIFSRSLAPTSGRLPCGHPAYTPAHDFRRALPSPLFSVLFWPGVVHWATRMHPPT